VASITAKADLLLLFSRYENFPCVIPEALACGVPVLSTRVGGIAEHLDADMGSLVRSEDEKAFAERIAYMLDHASQYEATKLRAYAVEHFGYEAIGKKFTEIYQRILQGVH
jgi:glycosyltransferase involved in cell wall biosynthesis